MEIRIFGKSIKSLRFFLYILSYLISKSSHAFNIRKSPEEYRKILIIRLDFMGDAVLNTALISAVKTTFRSAEVVLIADSRIAPLFESDENISNVIAVDKNMNLAEGMQLIRKLLKMRFDLVLDIT
ncbi:MAG: hypothetical protein GF315_08270, partial [candidate division Zixibacteria bacterium]|nr:hypothetical protein [candidate division Zixibacteria bacterium]